MAAGADLFVWRPENQTLTNITSDSAINVYTVWRAGSRRIVSAISQGSAYEIVERSADGTGDVVSLTTQQGAPQDAEVGLVPSAISPDERWLIYRRGVNDGLDLGWLPLDGDG